MKCCLEEGGGDRGVEEGEGGGDRGVEEEEEEGGGGEWWEGRKKE